VPNKPDISADPVAVFRKCERFERSAEDADLKRLCLKLYKRKFTINADRVRHVTRGKRVPRISDAVDASTARRRSGRTAAGLSRLEHHREIERQWSMSSQ
jgi:hypothetical protein